MIRSGFLTRDRGGQEQRIFEKAKATFDTCAGYVRRVTHDEIADAIG